MLRLMGCSLCVVLSAVTVCEAASWLRVTRSVAMTGASQSLSLVETPAGGVAASIAYAPQAGQPAEKAERRSERSLPAPVVQTALERLRALGILELEDVVQTGIEDAPVYSFEGELDGRVVEFTVRGLLAEIPDGRYGRIFGELEGICP